jgi:hypothetical protein
VVWSQTSTPWDIRDNVKLYNTRIYPMCVPYELPIDTGQQSCFSKADDGSSGVQIIDPRRFETYISRRAT